MREQVKRARVVVAYLPRLVKDDDRFVTRPREADTLEPFHVHVGHPDREDGDADGRIGKWEQIEVGRPEYVEDDRDAGEEDEAHQRFRVVSHLMKEFEQHEEPDKRQGVRQPHYDPMEGRVIDFEVFEGNRDRFGGKVPAVYRIGDLDCDDDGEDGDRPPADSRVLVDDPAGVCRTEIQPGTDGRDTKEQTQ